jgi:UDP-glucose 4-epimerase
VHDARGWASGIGSGLHLGAKVLITGATGFVGRRVVERILEDGRFNVRAVTRNSSVQIPPGIEAMPGFDLTALERLDDVVADVDCIVHLAARVHVRGLIDETQRRRYDAINVDGTLALAARAASAGVRRFVFVSTIAVNGSSTEPGHPFDAQSPRAPKQPYAYSKSAAEKGLEALARETQMEVVIIRPPLVYGPRVKGNFRGMMDWLSRGVPLPFGAITDNRRTLVALDNLVDLIHLCLDHPLAANEIFLLGDGEDLSTVSLLGRLAEAMGVRARLVSVSPRLLETAMTAVGLGSKASRLLLSLQVDSSKAQNLLGWRPRLSVDEGLQRAAAHFRATGRISDA